MDDHIFQFDGSQLFKPDITTLRDTIQHLEAYAGSVVITLNVVDKDGVLVISSTTPFAHIKKDSLTPDTYFIESGGKIHAAISGQSLDRYRFTRKENGIQFVYTYSL